MFEKYEMGVFFTKLKYKTFGSSGLHFSIFQLQVLSVVNTSDNDSELILLLLCKDSIYKCSTLINDFCSRGCILYNMKCLPIFVFHNIFILLLILPVIKKYGPVIRWTTSYFCFGAVYNG